MGHCYGDTLVMAKEFGDIYVDDRFIRTIDVSTNEFPTLEQFDVFRDAHRDVTEVELLKSKMIYSPRIKWSGTLVG